MARLIDFGNVDIVNASTVGDSTLGVSHLTDGKDNTVVNFFLSEHGFNHLYSNTITLGQKKTKNDAMLHANIQIK